MNNYEISNITVYVTTDYNQFKRLLGNRDTKGVAKIKKSIEEVGFIIQPILCNEKLEVIDGQNRLEACKQLGLPIYYTVTPGLGIRECRALNIGQTNWGVEDFIYSYAESGIPDYQRLYSLISVYKKPLEGWEAVATMACPHHLRPAGTIARNNVSKGDFKMSEEDYRLASVRIQSAISLGFADFAKQRSMVKRSYWGAVSYAYQNQDVSVKELIQKLQMAVEVLSTTDLVSQLKVFDDIYNKGRRAGTKVFMAADFQRRLYL